MDKLDEKRIFRIGVDWLTIYNFNLVNKNNIGVIEEVTPEYYKKKLKIEESLYYLESYTIQYSNDVIKKYESLRINPNKINFGNNIYNSESSEIMQAFNFVKEDLNKKGIQIEFNGSKVRDIEININFKRSFSELKESMTLLFKQMKDVKKISNQVESDSLSKMYVDSTLQSTYKTYSTIAYDKNRESNLKISFPITRLEIRLKESAYKYYLLKKYGRDTTLKVLLEEFNLIEKLYRDHIRFKFFVPSIKYLEKIQGNLEKRYERFKKSSKFAAEKGIKQQRNVYKYLEEGWIFDYNFLIEVIKKYDKKHKGREIDRIKRNYIHHNNLEKLDYMMNIIFPTNHK